VRGFKYIGEVKNGFPDGRGRGWDYLTTYDSEWKDGKLNGYGEVEKIE
jgi:hypothetical protein